MTSFRLADRARAQASDPLLRSAYSLMVNTAVTTGLGVVFWVVAARMYSAETVGRDAALIISMLELSVICQLNLGNVLTRFLPSLARGTARALLAAYASSGAAAIVVGTAFVVIVPLVSNEFDFLSDWPLCVGYVLAQISWAWFFLQDAALTAMRRAPWVPVENGVFGILKLGLLVPLAIAGAVNGIFVAWIFPVVLLLVPVNVFLFRTAIPEHVRVHQPSGSALEKLGRRRLVRFLAHDYGASLLAPAAVAVLPVLVVALLGAAKNAYLFIPFTIVVSVDTLFYGIGTALVVEGALAEDQIRALTEKVIRRFAPLAVIASALMIVAAPLILLPFGHDYAREGTGVLRILACGCIFHPVIVLFSSIARLQGNGRPILLARAAQGILLLGGTVILAHPLGLIGIALAWVGSLAVVALAVLPWLLRFLRSPKGAEAALVTIEPQPEELAVP